MTLEGVDHIIWRTCGGKSAGLLLLNDGEDSLDCTEESGCEEAGVRGVRVVLVSEGEEVSEGVDFVFAFKDEGGIVEGVDGVVLAVVGSGTIRIWR